MHVTIKFTYAEANSGVRALSLGKLVNHTDCVMGSIVSWGMNPHNSTLNQIVAMKSGLFLKPSRYQHQYSEVRHTSDFYTFLQHRICCNGLLKMDQKTSVTPNRLDGMSGKQQLSHNDSKH
jgi:hypothetical protein